MNVERKNLIIEKDKDKKTSVLENGVDELEQNTRIDDIIMSGFGSATQLPCGCTCECQRNA